MLTLSRKFNSVTGIEFEIFLRSTGWLMQIVEREKTITGKYDQCYLQGGVEPQINNYDPVKQ